MKFTKPNENGILSNKFFETFSAAKEYFGSSNDILPVIGMDEWQNTSKDYKGYQDGKPYLLYMSDKGTTYGECNIVYSI